MSVLQQIRLFESEDHPRLSPNDMGKLYAFDSMNCLEVIDRLLYLFRDKGFSLGAITYLYLVFCPRFLHGEVMVAFRFETNTCFFNVGCDVQTFNSWDYEQKCDFVIASIRRAIGLFTDAESVKIVDDCFEEVLRYGAELAIPYKEKQGDPYTVRILVKITDDLDFIPIVRVLDGDTLIREVVLPPYSRDPFVLQFGTISVGKKSVRITPRKSYDAEYYELKAIKIEI